jgi:multiple sugar transport system permease protein
MKNRRLKSTFFYVMLVAIIFVIDFPVIWMILVSIQPLGKFFQRDLLKVLIPSDITFKHYYNVLFSKDYASDIMFPQLMLNSFIVSGAAMGVGGLISVIGGYSLARFRYKGRNLIAQGSLYVYMFPKIILVTPLLVTVVAVGLFDTRLSLVGVYTSFVLPYSLWMMRGYFISIPSELEEAAMIDGCSRFQAFLRVILPLATPGVVATAIYCFILSWNNVIYPLAFINSQEKQMLSIGFLSLLTGDLSPWNGIMAAATMTAVPVVLLFSVLQTGLVKGLAAGAVKG